MYETRKSRKKKAPLHNDYNKFPRIGAVNEANIKARNGIATAVPFFAFCI